MEIGIATDAIFAVIVMVLLARKIWRNPDGTLDVNNLTALKDNEMSYSVMFALLLLTPLLFSLLCFACRKGLVTCTVTVLHSLGITAADSALGWSKLPLMQEKYSLRDCGFILMVWAVCSSPFLV